MSEHLNASRRVRRTARGALTVMAGGVLGVLFAAAPAYAAPSCAEAAGVLTITHDTGGDFIELRKLDGSVGTAGTTFVWSLNNGAFTACTGAGNVSSVVVTGAAGDQHIRITMGTAATTDTPSVAPRADYNYQGINFSIDLAAGTGDAFLANGTTGDDSWTLLNTGVSDLNGTAVSGGAVTLANTEHVLLNGDWAFSDCVTTILGNDTINASGVTVAAPFANQLSLNGCHGNDTLTGSDGIDNLIGLGGNDVLNGGPANDQIWPGFGDDRVNGGAGQDRVRFDSPSATSLLPAWVGPTETIPATGTTGVTVTLNNPPLTPQNTVVAGNDIIDDIEDVLGTAADDTITGSNGANTLNGAAGNDIIRPLFGDDTVIGGANTGPTFTVTTTNATIIRGDIVDYGPATCGVTVNLATLVAQNTICSGSDTISGIESLFGSPFNDVLTGDASANFIRGGAGDDTINGAAGADVVDFGDATAGCTFDLAILVAQATGCAGTDTVTNMENVLGGGGGDTIFGDAAANVLIGGNGNDNLHGRAGADALDGGAGDDTLEGGLGGDTLTGGLGIDTILYSGSADGVIINLTALTAADAGVTGNPGEAAGDTINGAAAFEIENVTGSQFQDTITGNELANRLLGLGGNDSLSGAGGDDVIEGGAGNDTNMGGTGNDVFTYLLANDAMSTYFGDAGLDTLNATGNTHDMVVDITAELLDGRTGAIRSVENINSGSGNDILRGDSSPNILNSDGGNDIVEGRGGDDTVNTGAGDDVAFGGVGNDSVDGGDGNDLVSGDDGNDSVDGGAGDDQLAPGRHDDVVNGGPGEDWVDFGFEGDSTGAEINLFLGQAHGDVAGTDVLVLATNEHVRGTLGADVIIGDGFNNILQGLRGDDKIVGRAGDDILLGNAGDDNLRGNAGDDDLRGASNDDLLNGGSGSDIHTAGTGRDQITSRDGEADFVDGRKGRRDRCLVDRFDTTARCEIFS